MICTHVMRNIVHRMSKRTSENKTSWVKFLHSGRHWLWAFEQPRRTGSTRFAFTHLNADLPKPVLGRQEEQRIRRPETPQALRLDKCSKSLDPNRLRQLICMSVCQWIACNAKQSKQT
jgi:hypothetical protein